MSDEQPVFPANETEPCLEYAVLSIDEAQAVAEVRFFNPDHTGSLPVQHTRLVPGAPDETGQPTTVEETYEVDEDPNPHAVKSIRVPLADGHVDHAAWQQRLIEQARGVKARMLAAQAQAPAPAPGALDVLLTED